MREIKFRVWDIINKKMLQYGDIMHLPMWEVLPGTPEQRAFNVMMCIGAKDRNKQEIFEGDILEFNLPCGEVRVFEVVIKTVTRKVVNHPDFLDGNSKVNITGVVLLWQGYELFSCVDEHGVSDISKMKVIGNIYENPWLLEV